MYPIGSKLGVKNLLYTHVGAYMGNDMVFHNNRKNGVELIPLQQFSNGKRVTLTADGVADIDAFLGRVRYALGNPRPYNLLNYNCEHATSYVRDGVAFSSQVFFGGLALLAVSACVLLRGTRA